MIYSSKDIYNHALKLQKKMADSGVLEKYLTQVEVEGGTVNWTRSELGEEVTVLWIQTKDMKDDILRTKPHIWQTDTTFGTNRYLSFIDLFNILTSREGYKLYVPLYKSAVTGRYEAGGYLFLATENQELVCKYIIVLRLVSYFLAMFRGLQFFKQSLNYTVQDTGENFIIFVDKDFSYIEVRQLFQAFRRE